LKWDWKKGMACKVKQICQIEIGATIGRRRPSVRDVDLVSLASTADALSAEGRNDLAAFIVEALYYCAERQRDHENVILFPGHQCLHG
jgi:hypothetical protein